MKNKLCLVTGGTGGLGEKIIETLVKNNYSVAFTYLSNKEKARQIQKKFKLTKGYKINFSKIGVEKNLIKLIEKENKNKIYCLINNAGIAQRKGFLSINQNDLSTIFQINFFSSFLLSQSFIKELILKNRFGKIINISSLGGQVGGVNQPHYAASKAALINLTKSLTRLYPKNLQANTISVGLAKTKMALPEMKKKSDLEKIKSIPIGRTARPEEIANIVKFLCSEESNYIVGQTINANGGAYLA